jgi:hypothetical protein
MREEQTGSSGLACRGASSPTGRVILETCINYKVSAAAMDPCLSNICELIVTALLDMQRSLGGRAPLTPLARRFPIVAM